MRGWFDVRPPGGGLAFYVGFMILISAVLIVFSITGKLNDPLLEWIASGMFVVGVGLWLKHSWARWVAFAFFSFVAIASVIHLGTHGISAQGIIRLLIVLSTLYALWEWDVWPAETTSYRRDYPYDDEDDEEEDVDDGYADDEAVEEDEIASAEPAQRPSFWSTRS